MQMAPSTDAHGPPMGVAHIAAELNNALFTGCVDCKDALTDAITPAEVLIFS